MTKDNGQHNQSANAAMVLDIVEQTLAVAHDLQATGSLVTHTLRELTGAHAILLSVVTNKEDGIHRNIAFTPDRRGYLVDSEIILDLINNAKNQNKVEFIVLDKEKYSRPCTDSKYNLPIENAVVAPLTDAQYHIGTLLLLGLPPDEAGRDALLMAIKLLSNFLALIIRTSLLYENQEELISRLKKEVNDRIHAEKELKNATAQLIQTEKLVSIGQLAAGVAHEINSPLGAIRSSNDSINYNFLDFYYLIQSHCHSLEKYKDITSRIIELISKGQHVFSSREHRKHKADIAKHLKECRVYNYYEVAELLTSVGIYENYDEYISLFVEKDNADSIIFLQKLSHILQGNNIINMAVKQSSRVVNALRDFARSDDNAKIVETNVRDTIETALTLYRNVLKHGIDLKLNFESVPTIYGYPHKLCQVWTNLIQNSAYAMKNTGILEISLKEINNQVQVIVADSGPGIPENIIDKIFEPLFTTKQLGEGTGLGLDIVKQIILKHNGCINIESPPGKGATFTVTLPIGEHQA